MGVGWWMSVGCLLGAVVVTGWPSGGSRPRWRAIGNRSARSAEAGRDGQGRPGPAGLGGWLPAWISPAPSAGRWTGPCSRRPGLTAALLAGGAGLPVGGPVAAFGIAVYTGIAVRAMVRRRESARRERRRRAQLDGLCALAADLRAGRPIPADLGVGPPVAADSGAGPPTPDHPCGPEPDRIAVLTGAAARLAERTGAPLAELVERIEADVRATERGIAAASAQAAGARATAWLLAGLPLGGIALGYGIGVDPLRVLLHQPVGAASGVAAIVLQCAGLAWAERLTTGPTRTA